MKAGSKQRWLSSIATASLLCAIAASPATAQALDRAACAQHTVTNGIHHQPTTADIESAQSVCGISDPVDTSPAIGALIDEINNELLGEESRN
jgi:hypothetical protein